MKTTHYPTLIQETFLDSFGHVNNAMYLTLFEEARWDLINRNGYGIQKIRETGLGPTILELKLRYIKELRVRDKIDIETAIVSYEKKIGKMTQRMLRDGEECAAAEFTFGLFSLSERKLVLPTPDWLTALGLPP